MDWQKVISSLQEQARHHANESDRFRHNMTATPANQAYMTATGSAAITLSAIAGALQAGLEKGDADAH